MARRARGEGSVYRRANRKGTLTEWAAEKTIRMPDGRRRRVTGYGTTQKEAIAERNRKSKAILASAPHGHMLLNAYLDHFLDGRAADVAANLMSIRTYETYESDIRVNIKPHLGTITLNNLQASHIEEWLRGLLKNKTATVARRARATLNTALERAIDGGYLNVNPIPKRSQIRERAPEIVVWTEAETMKFLSAAKEHRLYALFYVSISTGMRQGELLGLRWPDIDLDRNEINIRRSLKTVPKKHQEIANKNKDLERLQGTYYLGEPKTPRSRRTVAIALDTIRVLAAHHEAQLAEKAAAGAEYVDHKLVFCNSGGTPLSQSNLRASVYNPLIKQAGVPPQRFHDKRDLSASLLIANGVDIAVVSERLGHSRTSTTWDKYVRVVNSARERSVMTLGSLLGNEDES